MNANRTAMMRKWMKKRYQHEQATGRDAANAEGGVLSMNNERLALLRCIVENRKDMTPRRVYADWIDEHGTCDRDAATEEYIRGGSLEWLRENYARLVPKFMRYYCRANLFPQDYEMYESAPTVKALVRVSRGRGHQDHRVWLNFDGGFLVRTWTPSFEVTRAIRGYLLDDQPLAVNCYGGGDDSRMSHENRPLNPAVRMFEMKKREKNTLHGIRLANIGDEARITA